MELKKGTGDCIKITTSSIQYMFRFSDAASAINA